MSKWCTFTFPFGSFGHDDSGLEVPSFFHSTEMGMHIEQWTFGGLTAKTETISLPGVPRRLDFSAATSGAITFENETITIEGAINNMEAFKQFEAARGPFRGIFEGKVVKIFFGTLDWRYSRVYREGRCKVKEFTPHAIIPRVVLEIDANPYWIEEEEQSISIQIKNGLLLDSYQEFDIGDMPLFPRASVPDDCMISVKPTAQELETREIVDIVLHSTQNQIRQQYEVFFPTRHILLAATELAAGSSCAGKTVTFYYNRGWLL